MTQWLLVFLNVWKKCNAFTFKSLGSRKDIIRIFMKFCFIFWPSKSPLLLQSASTGNSHLVTRFPQKYEFQDRRFNLTQASKSYSIAWRKTEIAGQNLWKIWSSGQGRLQRAYSRSSSHCLPNIRSVTFNIDNQYESCTWIHLQRIAFVWWECRLIKRGRCTDVRLYCWLVHQEEGSELEMKLALLLITIWMEIPGQISLFRIQYGFCTMGNKVYDWTWILVTQMEQSPFENLTVIYIYLCIYIFIYLYRTRCNVTQFILSGNYIFRVVPSPIIKSANNCIYVVCFLLGNSPASEFYKPTFRNTLFVPSS
jgi:hypothetical protein